MLLPAPKQMRMKLTPNERIFHQMNDLAQANRILRAQNVEYINEVSVVLLVVLNVVRRTRKAHTNDEWEHR